MGNVQTQETPTKQSHSQGPDAPVDPEVIILARVYALILSWPDDTDAESREEIEQATVEPYEESSEPRDEVAISTFTTE